MRTVNNVVTVSAMLPLVSAIFSRRGINDPAAEYLQDMCLPLFSNVSRTVELHLTGDDMVASLANSPFPCEQELYIGTICTANGTTEIDFLAEQECLCNGAFWDVSIGCDDCFLAHGYLGFTPSEALSTVSSLSAAECSPTPPSQPYSNLLPVQNVTSAYYAPNITLGNDRFPNNTAVSNYFTATGSDTAGAITGSATGRLTTWTNISGIRYTPTSTPASSGAGSVASSTRTGAGGSSSTSASASVSHNVAAVGEVRFAGSLVAAAAIEISRPSLSRPSLA
jgi:hypothetical protein